MCGIAGFFARESVPDLSVLEKMFLWAEKRGQDGCGLVWIRNNGNGPRRIWTTDKDVKVYSHHSNTVKNNLANSIYPNLMIGDVLLFIARAAPETEGATDEKRINQTLQPICNQDQRIALIHNGAVSNSVHRELQQWAIETGKYKFTTDIDSESIIAAYVKYERNIKNAMEYLSGGFAAIMYDERKDMLMVINDFKPIAHAYVKGVGFFLHSDNDCLGEIIHDITGCSRDGVFLWESWYHHYLSGAIREIDLQSGFMRKIKYSPRYIIGKRWDSNKALLSEE